MTDVDDLLAEVEGAITTSHSSRSNLPKSSSSSSIRNTTNNTYIPSNTTNYNRGTGPTPLPTTSIYNTTTTNNNSSRSNSNSRETGLNTGLQPLSISSSSSNSYSMGRNINNSSSTSWSSGTTTPVATTQTYKSSSSSSLDNIDSLLSLTSQSNNNNNNSINIYNFEIPQNTTINNSVVNTPYYSGNNTPLIGLDNNNRCKYLYIGTGLADTNRICTTLRCTNCDFSILRWINQIWLDSITNKYINNPKQQQQDSKNNHLDDDNYIDYLFLRNNMPSKSKLEAKLVNYVGGSAYCCQCSWVSLLPINNNNSSNNNTNNNNNMNILLIRRGGTIITANQAEYEAQRLNIQLSYGGQGWNYWVCGTH